MKPIIWIFSLCLLVTGCSTMKPEDFANKTPKIDLFAYFDGQTQAWGIFEDRFGTLRREFRVDITGSIDGDILTLDEQFDYADGEKDRRIWYIRKNGDNTFAGRAADIVGTASGIAMGNAFNWTYEMDLDIGSTSLRVRFDDWMFLQEGGVLINRARVSKWGLEIGEVTLFFMKPANVSSRN